jgi:hypothetical protein
MSRRARERRVVLNTMDLAKRQAALLSAADVQMQATIMRTVLDEYTRGTHCPAHWCSLADAANLAETLAGMGLGSGQDAEHVIEAAQRTLHDVFVRQQQRGSWTLYADEIDALNWLLALHNTQLAGTTYGEFEAACRKTAERVSQARAGNAPAGAIVVVGQINSRNAVATP